MVWGLPRVVLDHELLVEIERHLVAARQVDDRGRQLGKIDAEPFRDLLSAGLGSDLERLALAMRLADLDPVARLHAEAGHVRGPAVDGEVAVSDELARLGP